MGRDIDFRDQGVANFFEGLAGGVNKIGLRAPATVAANFDIELLAALPGAVEALTIDATGQMGTTPAGGGSLDTAYDFPTPGAGRAITGDAGAVEITVPAASGNAALSLIQADNFTGLLISKTGVGAGSPVSITDAGTGITLDIVKTGPSGSPLSISGGAGTLVWTGDLLDVQGDNTSGALSVTSLDVGTNPVIKTFQFGAGPALHVDNSANAFAARVRLESGSGVTDATIEFVQNSIQRWEVGYDQSAAKLVIAPTSFTTPIFSIADTTGQVTIESLAQDVDMLFLDKKAGNSGDALDINNSGTGGAIFIDCFSAAQPAVTIFKQAANFALRVIGNVSGTAIFEAGVSANATVEVLSSSGGTGPDLFLNMDSNAVALSIDSEATSQPLILLAPLTGNSRGDIALGTARTADASSPAEGDVWYNSTLERLQMRLSGLSLTAVSRYVASAFLGAGPIIAGVVTLVTGNSTISAETGTADDLDTINTSPAAQNRDEMTIKADPGDTITVKHNVGNIHLDGSTDKVLVNGNHFKLKFNEGSGDWEQLTPMMVLP